MVRAVAAAKAGDCDKAFKLTLICQCHDGTAQERLKTAGPRAVCGYLYGQIVGRRSLREWRSRFAGGGSGS
jgi:hypothetical protein